MPGPRALLSWHTDPDYIAPPRLFDDQTTLAPMLGGDGPAPINGRSPLGPYDLKQSLKDSSLRTDYDVIIVSADAMQGNLPNGLDQLPGQKILLLGDTHHGIRPLANMVGYALAESFDAVIFVHNRHHAHWFVEAGVSRAIWLPGLCALPIERFNASTHIPELAFLGQIGEYHPRRQRLYQALTNAGVPVAAARGSATMASHLYGGHVASWNASLNGDLNLRVFEILAAGGCLLTDRLSPLTGIGSLFEEGRHFLSYDTPEQLVEHAQALLGDPMRAAAIASAGADAYHAAYTPAHWIAAFRKFVTDNIVPDIFSLTSDLRMALNHDASQDFIHRLKIYELVQELQCKNEQVSLAIAGSVPVSLLYDLCDLHRVKTSVLDPTDDASLAIDMINGSLGGQMRRTSLSACAHDRFDLVITDGATTPPPGKETLMFGA